MLPEAQEALIDPLASCTNAYRLPSDGEALRGTMHGSFKATATTRRRNPMRDTPGHNYALSPRGKSMPTTMYVAKSRARRIIPRCQGKSLWPIHGPQRRRYYYRAGSW
jgi:hypothetical protein